jgi:prephenate dehydrogenase
MERQEKDEQDAMYGIIADIEEEERRANLEEYNRTLRKLDEVKRFAETTDQETRNKLIEKLKEIKASFKPIDKK